MRRIDAFGSASSSPRSSSPPPDAPETLKFEYAFVAPDGVGKVSEEVSEDKSKAGTAEDETVEFRLFAAKSNEEDVAHKVGVRQSLVRIKVRSPTPLSVSEREGAFRNPHRSQSYFFTAVDEERLSKRRDEYLLTAVSGEEVEKARKRIPWSGMQLPWRIIHIKSEVRNAAATSGKATSMFEQSDRRRRRKSKKSRIAIRRKFAATKVSQDAEAEKRTRRNREKKVKKKARDKAKKLETRMEKDAAIDEALTQD